MIKPFSTLIGCCILAGAVSCPVLANYAQAQTNQPETPAAPTTQSEPATRQRPPQTEFDGRGIAHGSVFNRGRNANVTLSVNQGRFTLNLAEPPGTRVRVRYQGAVARQTPGRTAGEFELDGRVQTFDSSASNRIFNNTTGTCRIEVYNSRVVASTCRSAAPDSTTQFLGLER
jgi:hypothetical protein